MELREKTFVSELKVDLKGFVQSYRWDMLHKNTFTFVLSFKCRILTDCDSSIHNCADEDVFGCPCSGARAAVDPYRTCLAACRAAYLMCQRQCSVASKSVIRKCQDQLEDCLENCENIFAPD